MDKPITLCDRCSIAARCLLNYDGIPCRKLRTVEPTNADRIRAMSDETLAGFLAFTGCPLKVMVSLCPSRHNSDKKCNARRCWLDWLKQEVGGA